MRLIGIKLGKCDSFIRKGLKENTWYPFGRYLEPTNENGWEWRTLEQKESEEACQRMYQSMAEDENESLSITVNCIVGKNGSCKTSLLDILYRIINNFSYRLLDKAWIENTPENNPQRGHNLSYAHGFEATLFFESDGVVGSIYNCFENVTYNYYSSTPDSQIIDEKMTSFTKTKIEQLTRHFFYSICTNYSIHSLNEEDFVPNKLMLKHTEYNDIDGKWIHGLFHKNDGYVAPIVMVPFRKNNGNIDIHNENALAKQRLATLAVLFASKGKKFLDLYKPTKLIYRFNYFAADNYNRKFNDLFHENFPTNKDCAKIKKTIIKHWSHILKEEYGYGFNNQPKIVQKAILNYITYKTLKTCIHYRKYGEIIGIRSLTDNERYINKRKLDFGFYLDTDEDKIHEVICEIIYNDSTIHVNLKIHQILSFLKHQKYLTSNVDILSELYNRIENVENIIELGYNEMPVYDLFIKDIDNKKNSIPFHTYDDTFLYMPPAIFDWEICFSKVGSREEETLSQMSSGERQFMHSISYIIYHIKNIESVLEGRYRIKYHNICLIFDEAELYYHPEFQRGFVANMIRMLSWCHINHNIIRGVNILIVTHSPFVLSDIPLDNTLYLEDGDVSNKLKETYCGNVHELLGGSFFMDYSIGEVARENVEEIIKLYNNSLNQDGNTYERNLRQFNDNKKRYEYVASIIADDFLYRKVNDMMSEMEVLFGDSSENDLIQQIYETKKRLKLLQIKRQRLQNS